MKKHIKTRMRGFTPAELMVVLVILVVLMAMRMPTPAGYIEKFSEAEACCLPHP